MKLIDKYITPCCATVGFFDGVHKGHIFLLNELKERVRISGLSTLVVTFEQSPRAVLDDNYTPQLLTSLEDKIRLISDCGIDYLYILPFDKAMAELTAQTFMAECLKPLGVEQLLIGYDNKFGRGGNADFSEIECIGKTLDLQVFQSKDTHYKDLPISSSRIRQALLSGEMDQATEMLGRVYTLKGTIVKGLQNGRKIGFPTANLRVNNSSFLIPRTGVYATEVRIEDMDTQYKGMTNIGNRPTFSGVSQSIETHILDFSGDIYDKEVRLSFLHYIREERKFSTISELAKRIQRDEIEIRKFF